MKYIDGAVCHSPATARFSGNKLFLRAAEGPCRGDGSAATRPRMFQCEGEGVNTTCYILAKDPTFRTRKFKSRALFYKK